MAIIGLGASAGGLHAMESLLSTMPSDSGAAFVLVSHLAPRHHSFLPELIQKHTDMVVKVIEHRQRVLPNHIHVIPPNCLLTLKKGFLLLRQLQDAPGDSLPINCFFESLARDQGDNAVGIVLSGNGSDGSEGIKHIKNAKGLVLAQKPDSAKYPSMPRSALATGLVDYSLSPDRMSSILTNFTCRKRIGVGGEAVSLGPLLTDPLERLFSILLEVSGNDFSHYKLNTISRRLQRRMDLLKMPSLESYLRFAEQNPREAKILFADLLIGVTSFFRTPGAFLALRQNLLKYIENKENRDQPFRVWVPACASGEEAYSIAMSLSELMRQTGFRFPYQVFATDLNEKDIEKARVGRYSPSSLQQLDPELVRRYLNELESGEYQIKKVVRKKIVFAKQNLLVDPPFTKIDLVCCRNLLIYLRSEVQRKVLSTLHYSLREGGILFLGSSESVGPSSELF
jgi:two-component system CheB/CheR fusion protein